MPRDQNAASALFQRPPLGQFDTPVQVLFDQMRFISRDPITTPVLGGPNHSAMPALSVILAHLGHRFLEGPCHQTAGFSNWVCEASDRTPYRERAVRQDGTMTTDCCYRQGLRFHLSWTPNEAGKDCSVSLLFRSRTSVTLKASFGETLRLVMKQFTCPTFQFVQSLRMNGPFHAEPSF
jgi:hypothetical protein